MRLAEIEVDSDDEWDDEQFEMLKKMIERLKLKRAMEIKDQIQQGNRVRKYRCECCLDMIGWKGACKKCEENKRDEENGFCDVCNIPTAGRGVCKECCNRKCQGWLSGIVEGGTDS